MQIEYKSIDVLDEMLRLAILERSTAVIANAKWIEQMAEAVFSAPPEVSSADEKAQAVLAQTPKLQPQAMLSRLRGELIRMETFGDLLSSAFQEKNLESEALAKATELSGDTLEQLARDNLFPNRVPVLLMKRLIELLGISFEKAKSALQNTAALMVENQSFAATSAAVLVRRRIGKKGEHRDDADDFVEPQSALDIYLQRLGTVCNKNSNREATPQVLADRRPSLSDCPIYRMGHYTRGKSHE